MRGLAERAMLLILNLFLSLSFLLAFFLGQVSICVTISAYSVPTIGYVMFTVPLCPFSSPSTSHLSSPPFLTPLHCPLLLLHLTLLQLLSLSVSVSLPLFLSLSSSPGLNLDWSFSPLYPGNLSPICKEPVVLKSSTNFLPHPPSSPFSHAPSY